MTMNISMKPKLNRTPMTIRVHKMLREVCKLALRPVQIQVKTSFVNTYSTRFFYGRILFSKNCV